jgi:lambda repressor-like predicted transcriptional regulator
MNIVDNSWIKLPRNFVNWSWYHDANMVQLYLYLLLNANVYDVKYNDITIKRGECLVSLNHLSKETGISLQKLRTGLTRLQRTKEIEYKKLQNGRIIVLVDFNKFQPIGIDEAAPDWIKLYRKICDWGWYHEPNMVHLYVYFMLKAKLVINNDSRSEAWQLNSTLRLLTKATGISEKSIRTCLARLQRTGEISYLPGVAHKQSVITLCNYDSYQATKISTNTVLTQERHNNIESVSEHNNSQISAQKERDITRCNYDSYQATKNSTNTVLTQEQHSSNTVLTQEQHSSNTALTTLKEYKNKRIKEIKNIDDDIAHVREGDFVEVLEVIEVEKENEQKKSNKENFADLVKSETTWLTAIQKKFKLLTSEAVKNKVDEFEIELVCRGKDKHEDMKDFKCHFCDWLEKNLRTINQPQASNRSPSPTSERWSGEKFVPKSSEGGIYEGNF